MMKGHGQTNQLHYINWDALDHASHAPQLTSCNYCVCACVCVCVRSMQSMSITKSIIIIKREGERPTLYSTVQLLLRCMSS